MNTKLRCLLLDDELPSLKYLKLLCQQIPELEIVRVYNSPKELLNELKDLSFDLLIMDIEMPEINGIELAAQLKDKALIFTTAYSEYAADAFDLHAIDYLRKPLTLERLKKAIAKVRVYQSSDTMPEKNFVQLNSDQGKFLLYFDQLAYIETSTTDSRDKQAFLFNGTSIVLKNISFDKLQELLPEDQFCRINKRELIALSIVQSFSYEEVKSNISSPDGNLKSFQLGEAFKNRLIELISI
ncbi:response regulator [Sphingobacterium sp. DK4209]|uniref:Response regulator n=1 Tax=Sphingobacterium zhuxiongii TaxID=2662364 RepID=A0A5Q0QCR4_9SPHI|nr:MULTISPECIES: response regulator [unclassified Sphingobacterium]MVZ67037.1 response regulator [Sphingobacterium sp. DK4209]QGA26671.1 response regulator [Sphingobacterium sp. dk4302]